MAAAPSSPEEAEANVVGEATIAGAEVHSNVREAVEDSNTVEEDTTAEVIARTKVVEAVDLGGRITTNQLVTATLPSISRRIGSFSRRLISIDLAS